MKGWFAVETIEGYDAVLDALSVYGVVDEKVNRTIIFGAKSYVQTMYSMQECLALIAAAKAVAIDPNASDYILINLKLIKDLAARTPPSKVVAMKSNKEKE